jgi:hypothetical protein
MPASRFTVTSAPLVLVFDPPLRPWDTGSSGLRLECSLHEPAPNQKNCAMMTNFVI